MANVKPDTLPGSDPDDENALDQSMVEADVAHIAELEAARDAAQTASEAKSRFLATVSHEIRTPLNGILGMADLLSDTRLSAEQRSYVDAVRDSGDALLHLINDLLDYSKIEAGHLALTPDVVDVPAMVEQLVELQAPRAHQKQIELVSRIDVDAPAGLWLDGGRLRQVLSNVIGNAIKFTVAGGVTVEVVAKAFSAQRAKLQIMVRDTGIGLSPDDQERVFAAFEQVSGPQQQLASGTGLGLAISRQLIEAMGGTLTVESEPKVTA